MLGLDVPAQPRKQKEWDFPKCKKTHQDMLASSEGSSVERARLLSVSADHATAWVNARPVPSLDLKLNPVELRVAVSFLLGMPVYREHTCVCGLQADSKGIHALSCSTGTARNSRHNSANDIIKRALVSAGVPAIREPVGLSRTDGKKPDGLTMVPWKGGRCLVWDFTCVNTLAASHVDVAATGAGAAAAKAEQAKIVKYVRLANSFEVSPVAVEAYGAWGPQGLDLIREIGRRVAEVTGEPRSTGYLVQAISMAVQRGNAAMVIESIPVVDGLEEVLEL
jgi:hypothetical protein